MTEIIKFVKTGGFNAKGEELLEEWIKGWEEPVATGKITTQKEIENKIEQITSALNKVNEELELAKIAQ